MMKKSENQMSVCKVLSLTFFALGLPFSSFGETSFSSTPTWSEVDQESTNSAPASSDTSRYRPTRRTTSNTNLRKKPVAPFTPESHNVAFHVGQVFLAGDLTKYQDALGSQLSYTYGVSDIFGFNSSLLYSNHSDKNFKILALNTGLRANFSWFDKVVPYGMVGLGFYRARHRLENGERASGVVFGVNIGPGIDLILNQNFYFGASLVFHDMFSKTVATSYGPKEIGGNFTRFMAHAGVTF